MTTVELEGSEGETFRLTATSTAHYAPATLGVIRAPNRA
jgi:hypothetical protein